MLNELVLKLSASKLDDRFGQLVRESFLLGSFLAVFDGLSKRLKTLNFAPRLGQSLNTLSFLILLVLFAALGLPQFASDKEALALIALAAGGIYLVSRLLGSGSTFKFNMMDLMVALYLGANIISSISSHYLPQSIKGLSKVAVYTLSYFLLKASLLDRKERLPWYLSAALLSGLAVSLYGLYQYKIGVAPLATWEDPTVENKGTRIYSTLGNPNLLAGYLLPLAPLALAMSTYISKAKSKLRFLISPLFLITAIITAVAIFLTGSRGGYLSIIGTGGFIVLALSVYFFSKKPKLIAPSALIFLAAAAALYAALHFLMPTFEQRLASIFAGSEHSSNAYRMHVWRASMAMFADNWWLGVGSGNSAFRLAYGLYMKSGFDALGTYCVPLEVGVETGILGLASFGLLILFSFARAHLLFYKDSNLSYLALGLAAALVSLMVQGLVDTVFYRPQVHFLFWLVIAAISALSSQEENRGREPAPGDNSEKCQN